MNLNPISALLLDLDGVVVLGPHPLPGAAAALRGIASRGLEILYVTNNGTITRAGLTRRLRRHGFPCRIECVMTASHAAARYIRGKHGAGARVAVVGERGLRDELKAVGLRPVQAAGHADWEKFRRSPAPKAAVVSLDRSLTYWKLCAALDAVRRGAELVACNTDPTWPVKGGVLPGTGSLVRLLEYASGTKAVLIGKPDPAMFLMLLRARRISPKRTLVIGDRLDVDIVAGKRLGSPTAVVLTGITRRADLTRSRIRPDLVLASLRELAGALAFRKVRR